jgi:hypothetical protein
MAPAAAEDLHYTIKKPGLSIRIKGHRQGAIGDRKETT